MMAGEGSACDAVVPLTPSFAPAAAEIHAQGQSGTFLTALGPAFLRALYGEMALSPHCLGYVALDDDEVVGIVVGTMDSGAVFKELMLHRGLNLALPVLGALIRRPGLLPKLFQTLLYPGKAGGDEGGELFFIGTRAHRRGEGIGRTLFHTLKRAMYNRGVKSMGLMVDDENETAKRFYRRNRMVPHYSFVLYGRRMHWYSLSLDDTHCETTDE